MAAIVRPGPGIVGLPSIPAGRVLAESALAILLRRRHCGGPAERMACRALVRRWVAVARGVA